LPNLVTTISSPAAAESSNRDSLRNLRNVTVFMSDNMSAWRSEAKLQTKAIVARVIGQSRLVGTPLCGVRTAQRAVPAIPGPPSLTDYWRASFLMARKGQCL
jgi:hypothetical protein